MKSVGERKSSTMNDSCVVPTKEALFSTNANAVTLGDRIIEVVMSK